MMVAGLFPRGRPNGLAARDPGWPVARAAGRAHVIIRHLNFGAWMMNQIIAGSSRRLFDAVSFRSGLRMHRAQQVIWQVMALHTRNRGTESFHCRRQQVLEFTEAEAPF